MSADWHGPAWTYRMREALEGAAVYLTELRRQGVIGGWGLGVNGVEPCLEALEHARPDVLLVAGRYTLLDHTALAQLFPACAARGVRFVYASSAATYGNGAQGFEDDYSTAHLGTLRPLNLYGWTKHAFDLNVARMVANGQPRPPQWAGLKFFNVYGPNEYHKGSMISVVKVKHDEVAQGQAVRLFRSDQEGLPDGQQKRDFIWVGDVVDVMLWLLDTPGANGLFNVGTGQARTYLDLAHAVSDAAGQQRAVEFIDMPVNLRGQYQSFTEASPARLRAAGYNGQFTPLELGIRRYGQEFLAQPDPYL